MKRAAAIAILVLAGCPTRGGKTTVSNDQTVVTDSDLERRQRLIGELQDEVLASYERDELPEVETTMIPPDVGPARIGVGPGDVLFGDDVRRLAWSRWPLQLEPGTQAIARSKALEIHLSHDKQVSAAWMSDELSWRITMCNRTAVIPMRITALYAHDGDRWVQVFEHLSFGRTPQPTADGKLRGAAIREAVIDRGLSDDLSRALNGLLSAQATRVKLSVSPTKTDDPTQPAPTFLLGPDPDAEWAGGQIESIRLVDGKVTLDERRVGVVTAGRPDKATIAYWIGNLVADLRHHPGTPASKVLLRGTFIFEKRDDKWVIVQGHISQPIDDIDLATYVYGTALIREKPLQITCEDGSRSARQQ
ncbi:MAG TPA: nuclear transport factor 2 family protein [Kofleriaceae bacterium]|nr:nuclear transport factor 2 family protein [Kofleriaceae bacterium]